MQESGGLTSGWTGWYQRGSEEAGLRTSLQGFAAGVGEGHEIKGQECQEISVCD